MQRAAVDAGRTGVVGAARLERARRRKLERELAERVAAGDELACTRLYREHAGRVNALVRRMIRDEMLAEDAAQDTWIRIYRGIHRFRGASALATWIHRVAVNAALNTLRAERRRTGRELPLADDFQAAAPSTEGCPLTRNRLAHEVSKLPPGMRRVLVLHDVQGHTHAEIGRMLRIAEGNSKSQLFKARAKLRRALPAHADLRRSA